VVVGDLLVAATVPVVVLAAVVVVALQHYDYDYLTLLSDTTGDAASLKFFPYPKA